MNNESSTLKENINDKYDESNKYELLVNKSTSEIIKEFI